MIYILLLYIGQLIKGVSFIFSRNFISLEEVGELSIYILIYNYLIYSHLGLRFSVDKEFPSLSKRLSIKEKNEYKSKVMTGIILLYILTISISFILLKKYFNSYKLLIILLASFFLGINEINKIFYRAEQNYFKLSVYSISYNILLAIVHFIFTYFFKLEGAIYSFLVLNIIFTILLNKSFRISIDLNFIKEKIKSTYIFFIIVILNFSILNIDKWIISRLKGNEVLGEYSIATLFLSFLLMFPTGLGELIFPKLIEEKDHGKLTKDKLEENIIMNLDLTYFMNLLFIIVVPITVKVIANKFINSIEIIQVLSINTLFYSVSTILNYIYLVCGKQKKLLKISSIIFLLEIILITVILNKNFELNIIPYVLNIVYTVYFILIFFGIKEVYFMKKLLQKYLIYILFLNISVIILNFKEDIGILIVLFSIVIFLLKENKKIKKYIFIGRKNA